MTITLYGIEMIVIGVYAPTYDSNQQTNKELFYEDLSEVYNKIKSHQEIVLAGDLNARVGSQEDDVVGRYGEVRKNSSGDILI